MFELFFGGPTEFDLNYIVPKTPKTIPLIERLKVFSATNQIPSVNLFREWHKRYLDLSWDYDVATSFFKRIWDYVYLPRFLKVDEQLTYEALKFLTKKYLN